MTATHPSSYYRLESMTEADAAVISNWRYPSPYDRYDWVPWTTACSQGLNYTVPDLRERYFNSVYCGKELCGFVQRLPLTNEDGSRIIRLGLGLHPDWCGAGRGGGFVSFLAAMTAEIYPDAVIDLEVAVDNTRAIKAYERAGFAITDEYTRPEPGRGDIRVYCMVYGKN